MCDEWNVKVMGTVICCRNSIENCIAKSACGWCVVLEDCCWPPCESTDLAWRFPRTIRVVGWSRRASEAWFECSKTWVILKIQVGHGIECGGSVVFCIIEILEHARYSLKDGNLEIFEGCKTGHLMTKGFVDMHGKSRVYLLQTPQHNCLLKSGWHSLIGIKFFVVKVLNLMAAFFEIVINSGSKFTIECLIVGVWSIVQLTHFEKMSSLFFKVVMLL